MVGFPEIFVNAKLQCALIFGQKLRRYTGLNHLVQAAREVLKNGDHVLRMQQDYEKVDFVRRLCLSAICCWVVGVHFWSARNETSACRAGASATQWRVADCCDVVVLDGRGLPVGGAETGDGRM